MEHYKILNFKPNNKEFVLFKIPFHVFKSPLNMSSNNCNMQFFLDFARSFISFLTSGYLVFTLSNKQMKTKKGKEILGGDEEERVEKSPRPCSRRDPSGHCKHLLLRS